MKYIIPICILSLSIAMVTVMTINATNTPYIINELESINLDSCVTIEKTTLNYYMNRRNPVISYKFNCDDLKCCFIDSGLGGGCTKAKCFDRIEFNNYTE